MRVLTCSFLAFAICNTTAIAQHEVQVVSPQSLAGPAAYGISKLIDTMENRGLTVTTHRTRESHECDHVIVAGLASEPSVARVITGAGLALPDRAEALAVCHRQIDDHCTVTLCGGDAVGLMYAALDVAERISWATAEEDLFAHVRNTSESPCLQDRSVSTYTMHRRLFEKRLYDPSYWEAYFDLLAKNRINSYVIIFGYENGGFMAPLYPYFFDVEGFSDVQLYGITNEQQVKNTAALRRVIDLAHERGIRFTPGIWDHIYRGGVQAGGIAGASELAGKNTPHLVSGLSAENLAPYTKAALKKFLEVFPDIDGIQFRMHWESGLTRKETPGFWRDVLSMLKEVRPDIRLDLRAKGLPDEVIEDAIALDLPFCITTKFWMEQLGLPFHPTLVNPQNQRDRRHGYADLLKYPKRYDMHWRIWSGGTSRFLLWGNPEYVRRFVQSARVYDGNSFEVNEMLATKMLGAHHDSQPFDLHSPRYRHYTYEFERYWHYYQLWGRLTYNPLTPSELWEREFTRRFGPAAGPHVMKALHAASDVLPRIVSASYNYRYFPTTRGWAEMMRLGDLPEYAKGTGTDVEQFQSYQDAARLLLAGDYSAKRTPFQTSDWFQNTANRILREVEVAQEKENSLDRSAGREFDTTITDLKILAYLARYHAARMKAAVWYNIYQQTEDRFALQRCITLESLAIDQWKKIIDSAGDVYPETLQFGVHRVGFSRHWKEELPKLEKGLYSLRQLPVRTSLDEKIRERILQLEASPLQSIAMSVDRPVAARPGQDLRITATLDGEQDMRWVRLRYRHLTQFEDYATVEMTLDSATGNYAATIPGSFIAPQWDLMYFVEAVSKSGERSMSPDIDQEMPYVIVPVKR